MEVTKFECVTIKTNEEMWMEKLLDLISEKRIDRSWLKMSG